MNYSFHCLLDLFLHLCTIKSPILGRFTSAKATVTMRILNAQRCIKKLRTLIQKFSKSGGIFIFYFFGCVFLHLEQNSYCIPMHVKDAFVFQHFYGLHILQTFFWFSYYKPDNMDVYLLFE
jgi:hypothetical protein